MHTLWLKDIQPLQCIILSHDQQIMLEQLTHQHVGFSTLVKSLTPAPISFFCFRFPQDAVLLAFIVSPTHDHTSFHIFIFFFLEYEAHMVLDL